MTVVVAVLAGLVIVIAPRHGSLAGVVAGCAIVGGPLLAVAGAAATFAIRHRSRIASQRRGGDAASSELLLMDVVALGVAGGLSIEHASDIAADVVGGELGEDLRFSVRSMAQHQPPAGRNAVVASVIDAATHSRSTGAPMAHGLAAAASQMRSDRTAERRRRLARVPVKLIFPLALLILPGFVLTVVAPAVMGGLARLGL
jgi:Type II secretion system (T2SS), protein F